MYFLSGDQNVTSTLPYTRPQILELSTSARYKLSLCLKVLKAILLLPSVARHARRNIGSALRSMLCVISRVRKMLIVATGMTSSALRIRLRARRPRGESGRFFFGLSGHSTLKPSGISPSAPGCKVGSSTLLSSTICHYPQAFIVRRLTILLQPLFCKLCRDAAVGAIAAVRRNSHNCAKLGL